MTETLAPDYQPTDDEPFMNSTMREFFRQLLLKWRAGLLNDSCEKLKHLQ